MKKIISLILSISIVIAGLPMMVYAMDSTPEISLDEFTEQLSQMTDEHSAEPLSNRIIVKSKRNIDEFDSVDIVEGYDDLHIVQFDDSDSAEQALEYYNDDKYIEYAEEDRPVTVTETETSLPENYDNHLSWGSTSIGIDDYFDYLGDTSKLPQIVVGIIDTGVDLDHEFLEGRIIETGFNNSSTGKDNSEDDDEGHGTHIAGIIADNTTDNVKIKAFKCLDNDGNGNLSDVYLAVNAAVENGVDVINMSLGTRGQSSLMEDAVNNATEQGVIVCAAAGNNANYAKNYTPANIKNCITVGAIDENDSKPLWSNFGDEVDIYAPGSLIYSSYNDGGYKSLSGTSMATPFVAATSALLKSNNKNFKTDEIKKLITDNSRLLEQTFLGFEMRALYIGVLNNFVNERASKPTFSMDEGIYLEKITVEIKCDDPDAEIYYSTNGKRASQNNGTLYTEPLTFDKVTTLNACAYVRGKLKSLQSNVTYNIVSLDPDENFEIDENGIITKYTGNNVYLSIPDKIKGITVTGLGPEVFRYKGMVILVLPDSLTSIGKRAVGGRTLKSVYAKNIKTVDEFAFYQCENLSEFDFSNMESVAKRAFSMCDSLTSLYSDKIKYLDTSAFSSGGLIYVNLPSVETVKKSAFAGCSNLETVNLPLVETIEYYTFSHDRSLKDINIPNVRSITDRYAFIDCENLETLNLPNLEGAVPDETFAHCYNLKTLNIPKVSSIGKDGLLSCFALKTLFVPQLKTTPSLPDCDNTNIYLSDACTELPATDKYKYNIIAPTNSYAEQWANENGHTFISSDSRDKSVENPSNVADLGRSICTSVTGLRFGFTWDNISEIESLANDVEYGFIYSQKGAEDLSIETVDGKNVKKALAPNRVENDGTTSFNFVISNIPSTYYDREITARAYVCIDGMYFYSNMLKGSFKKVAGLVLADDEIDQTTKNAIKNLLAKEA